MSSSLADLPSLLLSLVVGWLMTVMVSLGLSGAAFGPLRVSLATPSERTQFRLSDLVTLLVHLQIGASVTLLLFAEAHGYRLPGRVVGTVFVCAVLATWWWCGVRTLAGGRVTRAWDRFWFLAIVNPTGFLISLTVLIVPVGAIATGICVVNMMLWSDPTWMWPAVGFFSVACVHLGILGGCRLVCDRIATRAARCP